MRIFTKPSSSLSFCGDDVVEESILVGLANQQTCIVGRREGRGLGKREREGRKLQSWQLEVYFPTCHSTSVNRTMQHTRLSCTCWSISRQTGDQAGSCAGGEHYTRVFISNFDLKSSWWGMTCIVHVLDVHSDRVDSEDCNDCPKIPQPSTGLANLRDTCAASADIFAIPTKKHRYSSLLQYAQRLARRWSGGTLWKYRGRGLKACLQPSRS